MDAWLSHDLTSFHSLVSALCGCNAPDRMENDVRESAMTVKQVRARQMGQNEQDVSAKRLSTVWDAERNGQRISRLAQGMCEEARRIAGDR